MARVTTAVILAAAALAALPASQGFTATPFRLPTRYAFGRVHDRVRRSSTPTPVFAASPEQADDAATDFSNDGAFAWMLPYMEVIGWKPGKMLYGALPVDVDASAVVPAETAAARRNAAAETLQNIGTDERARRDQLGNVFVAASLVYATWASLLADEGGLTGHVLRLCLAVPLFLAVGLKVSAQEGL
jgi:hypothetical protein